MDIYQDFYQYFIPHDEDFDKIREWGHSVTGNRKFRLASAMEKYWVEEQNVIIFNNPNGDDCFHMYLTTDIYKQCYKLEHIRNLDVRYF